MQELLDKQHPMLEIWYIVNILQETFLDKQSMYIYSATYHGSSIINFVHNK